MNTPHQTTGRTASGHPDLSAALPQIPACTYPVEGTYEEQLPCFHTAGNFDPAKALKTLGMEAALHIAKTGQLPDFKEIGPTSEITDAGEMKVIPERAKPDLIRQLCAKGLLTTGAISLYPSAADFSADGKFSSQKALEWLARRAKAWRYALGDTPQFADLLPRDTALIPAEKQEKLKAFLQKNNLIRPER